MPLDEKAFTREVQLFIAYSRVAWPLHRQLARQHLSPRCRKCILSSRYAPLDSEGICEFCKAARPEKAALGNDPGQVQELHDRIKQAQGKGKQFDALVLFSGGKDSTYLVYRLRQEFPGLRMLLMTIDNTFMSPVAIKNISTIVQRLDIPHLTVRPPAALYNKMFRYAFLHLNSKGCSGTVDQFDGDFFHDVGRNWAAEQGIPLLISGCSKTQVEKILGWSSFESPRSFETSRRTHVAGFDLSSIFTPEELKYWWDGTRWDADRIPTVLFPFYAWDMEEEDIKRQVLEWGLLQKNRDHPLLTNMQLIPLMTLVDMCQLGYSSYEPEFCQMIRRGKADAGFWRPIFELSEYSARTGRFISPSTDELLKRLDLTREQLKLPQ